MTEIWLLMKSFMGPFGGFWRCWPACWLAMGCGAGFAAPASRRGLIGVWVSKKESAGRVGGVFC